MLPSRRNGTDRAAILGAVLLTAGCAGMRPAGTIRQDRAAYGAYLRGLMLERSARLPEAIDAYRLALEHDTQSPLLHVRLGGAYVKSGQVDRALQSFSRALSLEPDQPDALRWVAMLHASQGQLDRAVVAYERLLRVEPNDQFVMSTLADLYVLQGDLPKAISIYQKLIAEFGSTSQYHFNLGVLYGRLTRFSDAIEELSRAFERSPDSLEIRVALGLTYELSGRFAEAAACYEDAIRLDALNPRLYHHAARAHLSARQYGQATADYQTVLDLTPQDLEAIMGLVRVWLAQRRYDEAARFLGQKLKELGDPPELYVALGIVYREAKQATEAMRAFERATRLKDNYAQAHFYLAAQLDQLGRRQDARATLRHTIELEPNHPDALNYLGYLDAEDGTNLEGAKALIERALELDPDNGAYLDSLGWVYYRMGQVDEAVTQLERAVKRLDTDPVIFDHLGEAYFKRSDYERARYNWERALELKPDDTTIRTKLDRLKPHEVTTTIP